MIFLDECSFNLSILKNRGWSYSNRRIYHLQSPKSINYSLLTGMSKSKIYGFIISEGPIYTETFVSFLSFLIQQLKAEGILSKTVIVCDNASIHKSKFFEETFHKKINIIYTPPYTPELNPIELLWPQLRTYVKKNGPILNEDDLCQRIYDSMKKVKSEDCLNYFKHTLRFYRKCLEKKRFYE